MVNARVAAIFAIGLLLALLSAPTSASASTITRASVSSIAAEADGRSISPQVSADGRWTVFSSTADNLAGTDANYFCPVDVVFSETNNCADLFLHDNQTGTTELLYVAENGEQPDNHVFASDMTPDGRYIAFTSFASNIVSPDTNTFPPPFATPDGFVYDRDAGKSTLVNVTTGGQQGAGGFSISLTDDGRYAAFVTPVSMDPDDTNSQNGVYLRDLTASTLTWVSRWTTGVNGSNSSADSPSISGDGRFIAFRGNAIDYVPGATDYVPGIVIYDRQSGQFEALDLGQNTYGIMGANSPSIDSDGRFVTFLGYVPPLSSEILSEIFRYDRQTGDLALVSSAVGGGLGDRASDSPSISADGNLITFASMASNLSAVNTFGCPSIYVRNMASDSATLVSLNADGAAGRGNSQVPVISADGSAVAFASNARNLVPQDGNGLDDAFVASTGSAALGALTPSGVANCTGIAIGDINCDGEVTLSDALDLIKFFAGVKPYAECRFIGSPSMCGPGFTLFVAWKILMHVVDPTYDMGCNFK